MFPEYYQLPLTPLDLEGLTVFHMPVYPTLNFAPEMEDFSSLPTFRPEKDYDLLQMMPSVLRGHHVCILLLSPPLTVGTHQTHLQH